MAAPAFQLYTKEFLADIIEQALSLEEIGAYTKLMTVSWAQHGLPKDHSRLAIILGVSVVEFRKLWTPIASFFEETDTGWVHPRLERQRTSRDAFIESQSKKGNQSAAARAAAKATAKATEPSTGKQPDRPPPGSVNFNRESTEQATAQATDVQPSSQPEGQPSVNSSGLPVLRPENKNGTHTVPRAREKGHQNHAFCGRFCVPGFLHDEFNEGLGTRSGEFDLLSWYVHLDKDVQATETVIAEPLYFLRQSFKAELVERGWIQPRLGPPVSSDERKRLAQQIKATGGRCSHEPQCTDRQEHAHRLLNDWRRIEGIGPVPP